MTPNYFMHRAINVLDVIDHTTKPLTTEAYLDALGDDQMMLESVTLEEVEATYLYGLDTDQQMLLEAISTTKNRIEKTMAAFARALNQQLNSSGMEAYQAEIGKPAKSGQVAVMTARFPLSDGQSISVVFHSPSGDPGKIVAHDDLVAFRFLLNKRDVTHVVAPSGGQDISLKQTCLTLSNLAERNSAKFQSKQAETKAKEAELATLQASTLQMQAEAADVIEKADKLVEQAEADRKAEAQAQAKLDKQIAKNEELRRKLAGMGGDPVPSQTTKASPEPEPGSAPEGGAEPSPEPAVPAEPEKVAMPTDTIRKVNQDLNMDGESTLSNGAKIFKELRDEGGSLEGYITLTEPGGKSYTVKSQSSQRGDMDNAAKKLYKRYREGRTEQYLGPIPAMPEVAAPEQAAQPAAQDGDTSVFDDQWASAKSIIQEMLRNRYITKKDELADIRKKKGAILSANLDAMEAADPERFKAVLLEFDKEIKERGVISMIGPIGSKTKAARKIAEVIEGGQEAQDQAQAAAPEQTPEVEPEQSSQTTLHWYGLRSRPLSISAQPKGSVAYVEPGDVQTDPRTADMVKAAGENSARHGAVAYDHELTPQEVANYELTDFGRMAAAWNEPRRTAALDELKGTLDTLLGDGMSPGDIWKDLITPNGALVTNNPFYDWDEERYRGDELTKALQEAGYTGTVKNMFNQLVDQQWAAIEQANKSPEELEQERREKARQAGAAALNDLVKGARLPAGWSQEVDLAFGERAAVFVDTPDLPNGDEHEGYLITANANDAGELDGTFNVSSGNGDPIAPSQTDWEEISQAMQADYQKDTTEAEEQTAAKAAPAQEPTQAPGEGGEQPADNQWGETDPEVLALLEQAEQLRTTETDSGKYLADLQRIAADLEQAGAIERHEPYLHSVSDRLTELMEAEGV